MRRQKRLVGGRSALRDHRHAHAAGNLTAAFDSHQDEGRLAALQLPAPPDPGLGPTNPGVIHFDVALQRIASGIHHRPSELAVVLRSAAGPTAAAPTRPTRRACR